MAWVDVTVLGLVGGAPGGERMASFVDSAVTLGRADDPPLLDTVHLRRPSIEMVGIGALVSTHRNCFIILDFAGVPASRAYRAAGGGVEKENRGPASKKNKKKYAIRDSNPENLLGRQKCYPYTNGVFFHARSTDGCAAPRDGCPKFWVFIYT